MNKTSFSLFRFFESIGKPLTTYRTTEDGEMVANTWADNVINDANEQNRCNSLADYLYSAVVEITKIVKEASCLPKGDDNSNYFSQLPERIDHLLNLSIPFISVQKKGGVQ